MRYPGDTGLLAVVVGLRAASGLIANYLYCASLAVFLCWACRWLLCGKLSRALLSGPSLITAEGITARSQVSALSCFNPSWPHRAARNVWTPALLRA